MASDHPSFTAPSNRSIKIWRYMNFSKFVSMLEEQALYFADPTQFDDTFEGSFQRERRY